MINAMEEIWKPIVIEKDCVVYNYEGLYEVSSMGRVRSLDRVDSLGREAKGKVLKLGINNKGYLFVGLCKNGKVKTFQVHRLVATMFIPNPDNLPVVNHKNETKTDNRAENLEWCTNKYNANYGTRNERASEAMKGKYTGDKHPIARKVICLETKQVFGCTKDAEKWCGKTGVSNCCRGKSKTCGGYHWQFLDDYRREKRLQSDVRNSRLVA